MDWSDRARLTLGHVHQIRTMSHFSERPPIGQSLAIPDCISSAYRLNSVIQCFWRNGGWSFSCVEKKNTNLKRLDQNFVSREAYDIMLEITKRYDDCMHFA